MKNPWKTTGILVSTVGAGLLIGYGMTHTRRRGPQRLRAQQAKPADRRQVVGEFANILEERISGLIFIYLSGPWC